MAALNRRSRQPLFRTRRGAAESRRVIAGPVLILIGVAIKTLREAVVVPVQAVQIIAEFILRVIAIRIQRILGLGVGHAGCTRQRMCVSNAHAGERDVVARERVGLRRSQADHPGLTRGDHIVRALIFESTNTCRISRCPVVVLHGLSCHPFGI